MLLLILNIKMSRFKKYYFNIFILIILSRTLKNVRSWILIIGRRCENKSKLYIILGLQNLFKEKLEYSIKNVYDIHF